jgi:ferredoxin
MARPFSIHVDYDKCVGSRICNAIAPTVFGLNADGQALVLDDKGGTPDDIVRMAAEGCPVTAIILETIDSEKGVP